MQYSPAFKRTWTDFRHHWLRQAATAAIMMVKNDTIEEKMSLSRLPQRFPNLLY